VRSLSRANQFSPWSKGGWVNSQVCDHTSLIRFLEQRFGEHRPGLIEKNITPWRRAVAGDLTSTLDFKSKDSALVALPNTAAFAPPDYDNHPDYVPAVPSLQSLPKQEPGVRPARAPCRTSCTCLPTSTTCPTSSSLAS
jgi:phospholipase C